MAQASVANVQVFTGWYLEEVKKIAPVVPIGTAAGDSTSRRGDAGVRGVGGDRTSHFSREAEAI